MNGAALLMRTLESEGVDLVFGYPGGAIMPVYDALVDAPIRHVLTRHEQGAALAANGYARASGRVGVCLATSGPGATNLITGLADAFLDSVPMVAITGQVPTGALGTDSFQEVDTIGLTMPVVKHSVLVEDVADLQDAVHEAFAIARAGRPGPVVVDLPKDVATAAAPSPVFVPAASAGAPARGRGVLPRAAVTRARALLHRAERPVILAGAGIAMAGAVEEFRAFVRRYDAPVVTTLHGIGALPTDDPSCLGMLGMHGTRAANLAVQESDLLVCLGARLDDRSTGRLERFAPGAALVHVDIDPAELGKRRAPAVAVAGDLAAVLPRLAPSHPAPVAWLVSCRATAGKHAWRYDAPGAGVYAPELIRRLTAAVPGATFTCDVGQHQMWVAQHGKVDHPDQHLTSGGLGTMGFGVPAAMGACLAGRPGTPVIAFTGDGSLMMNVQELATIRRYDLPVKIVLFDNSGLGLVRQWQECFFDHRFSEVDLSDNPDFVQVAASFGIPGLRIDRADGVAAGIERLLATDGPVLAHVVIDTRENVWPLVPPNAANDEMIEAVPAARGAVCDTA